MDIMEVFAIIKSRIKGMQCGVRAATVRGESLVFLMDDGTIQTMDFRCPKDGASVSGAEITLDGHLILRTTDGRRMDAGVVPAGKAINTLLWSSQNWDPFEVPEPVDYSLYMKAEGKYRVQRFDALGLAILQMGIKCKGTLKAGSKFYAMDLFTDYDSDAGAWVEYTPTSKTEKPLPVQGLVFEISPGTDGHSGSITLYNASGEDIVFDYGDPMQVTVEFGYERLGAYK